MDAQSLFGTDGIRGPFGESPLDRSTLRRLGRALGIRLRTSDSDGPVLLGGDTRASTPDICRWLCEGLASANTSFVYGGILPTPAIARLASEIQSPLGIAVSASHNPYPDNGVKLIAHDGSKWEHEAERELEAVLLEVHDTDIATEISRLEADRSLGSKYLDLLAAILRDQSGLAGLAVTLDCANGAASNLAADLFERLGARVTVMGSDPDGRNINLGCGSTAPAAMAASTAKSRSHVGFAFDGDADRVILADEKGLIRDGDAILFLLAKRLNDRGELNPPRIVATTMSNLGLELALEREDIEIVRCDVGDRIVVQTLRREGLILGGEQSGHVVHLGLGPTGDGLQTALLVAEAIVRGGKSLAELLADFRTYPQILHNVRVGRKPTLETLPQVATVAREIENELGHEGRIVLRYSGTEPLARIMIEGQSQRRIESMAARLAETIESAIGPDE